jgi:hemerythrin-like domain-containing protein
MADSRDMIAAHIAFRREIGALPEAVARVGDGDVRQAEAVARHVDLVVGLLHHHQHGEDTAVWPLLRQRCPAEAGPLLAVMAEQHEALDRALRTLEAKALSWAISGSAADRDVLVEAAAEVRGPLNEHLDLEEEQILTLIDEHLTDREWNDVVAAEARTIPLTQLPLVIGIMLYDAGELMAEIIRSAARAPMWAVLSRLGRRAYAAHAKRIFGTSTPAHLHAYR